MQKLFSNINEKTVLPRLTTYVVQSGKFQKERRKREKERKEGKKKDLLKIER